MGDDTMHLLEQTVANNANDIREVKAKVSEMEIRIHDLKMQQSLTTQSVTGIVDTLNTLKSDVRVMDERMDKDIKDIRQEIRDSNEKITNKINQSNEKLLNNQIEQNKQYKTTTWAVAGTVIGSIIINQLFG